MQSKGGDLWMKELANTFIQPMPASGGRYPMPASGDNPWRHDKHFLRRARVFALPELFAQLGDRFTAATLYEYYLAAQILVHKRAHGASAPVRQAAAQERFAQTGRYGFGSGRRQ